MRPIFAALFAVGLLAQASAARSQPLIAADTLRGKLGSADLALIDIRTGDKDAGQKAFAAGHVPGAVHADYTTAGWRALRDGVTLYLPAPAVFETLASNLGITNDSHVVIIHEGGDASEFGAAARVYWTFKAMGHTRLSILDGGM